MMQEARDRFHKIESKIEKSTLLLVVLCLLLGYIIMSAFEAQNPKKEIGILKNDIDNYYNDPTEFSQALYPDSFEIILKRIESEIAPLIKTKISSNLDFGIIKYNYTKNATNTPWKVSTRSMDGKQSSLEDVLLKLSDTLFVQIPYMISGCFFKEPIIELEKHTYWYNVESMKLKTDKDSSKLFISVMRTQKYNPEKGIMFSNYYTLECSCQTETREFSGDYLEKRSDDLPWVRSNWNRIKDNRINYFDEDWEKKLIEPRLTAQHEFIGIKMEGKNICRLFLLFGVVFFLYVTSLANELKQIDKNEEALFSSPLLLKSISSRILRVLVFLVFPLSCFLSTLYLIEIHPILFIIGITASAQSLFFTISIDRYLR